ncbi:hypothetical protein SAMN05414139_01488 [Burkholderia sp. D7]|nr:hypothetical protein SAMN05414139_01488 [Burkholderia sp. D7]
MGRRILLRTKRKAPAARRRILFTQPAPHLVDGGPDLDARISLAIFDVLVKAAADAQVGALTPDGEAQAYAAREAVGRAADAMCQGNPVPAESRWAA